MRPSRVAGAAPTLAVSCEPGFKMYGVLGLYGCMILLCAPSEWQVRRPRWLSKASQAGTIRGLTDVLLELEGGLSSRSPIAAYTGDRCVSASVSYASNSDLRGRAGWQNRHHMYYRLYTIYTCGASILGSMLYSNSASRWHRVIGRCNYTLCRELGVSVDFALVYRHLYHPDGTLSLQGCSACFQQLSLSF